MADERMPTNTDGVQPVSTEQDAVRLHQQFIADYAPDGGDVEFAKRLSALIGARIDSLTAERDEARFALGMADLDIRGWFDRAEKQADRAEAAEAEVKRLREALAEAAVEVQHAHDGSREQCECEMHARFARLTATPLSEGR